MSLILRAASLTAWTSAPDRSARTASFLRVFQAWVCSGDNATSLCSAVQGGKLRNSLENRIAGDSNWLTAWVAVARGTHFHWLTCIMVRSLKDLKLSPAVVPA